MREAGTAALHRLLSAASAADGPGVPGDGSLRRQLQAIDEAPHITTPDLRVAFQKVKPSVSPADLQRYRSLERTLHGRLAHIRPDDD
jgi:hypothetical protein